jgi:hypothetical protein|tara:strand:+ start:578 stop:724 length:147 start_codon:yes stop_codon:yes gene_type:complete
MVGFSNFEGAGNSMKAWQFTQSLQIYPFLPRGGSCFRSAKASVALLTG